MNRRRGFLVGAVTLALVVGSSATVPTASAKETHRHHPSHSRPGAYTLNGDPADAAGSKFEGIGLDKRRGKFYVSETTGGEIHRGHVNRTQTRVWLPGDGKDGRFTARGITVDRAGRVYIAGGPNNIEHPGMPNLWVYDRHGSKLASFVLGDPDAYLNDVAIGPDGAAYFTDSNDPQIFRVARVNGRWQAARWKDASNTVTRQPGFNLGGIVVSPDRRALVVAQGNAGKLWRFDLSSKRVTLIRTGSTDLTGADGLVRQGRQLIVVRNFPRVLTTLKFDRRARSARLVREVATDPNRVFTTAKLARGRLLLVDSHFDEPVGRPPYQVVALPLRQLN